MWAYIQKRTHNYNEFMCASNVSLTSVFSLIYMCKPISCTQPHCYLENPLSNKPISPTHPTTTTIRIEPPLVARCHPKTNNKPKPSKKNATHLPKIIIHSHPKHNPLIYYSTAAPFSIKITRQRELDSQGMRGRKLRERREKRKSEGERKTIE